MDVEEFQTIEVFCSATGYPTPELSWERLDGSFSPSAYYRDGVLRIPSAQKSDTGTYRCIGVNNAGEHDQLIQIYVRDRQGPSATIYVTPDRYDATEGDEVTLRCETSGRGIVEWVKQGQRELPSSAYARGEALVIRNAQVSDSGRYLCTLKTPENNILTAHSDIRVLPRGQPTQTPNIKEFERKYVIIQGQDFSLPCEVTGDPRPSITWSLSGEELGQNIQVNGNILRVLNARPENSGVYVCVAESSTGTDQAATIIEVERKF